MNNFPSFLQLNQVKMNHFNDYVFDLLKLIDLFLHANRAGTQSYGNIVQNPCKNHSTDRIL